MQFAMFVAICDVRCDLQFATELDINRLRTDVICDVHCDLRQNAHFIFSTSPKILIIQGGGGGGHNDFPSLNLLGE